MYQWDDLRVFLAVARERSTLAAARRLGINQTTVARRIAALEHGLGVTLFERDPRGYVLTLHGRALVADAETVEAASLRLQAAATRLARDLAGAIRITATHPIMRYLVGPVVSAYREIHPEVTFEILSSAKHLSLEAGEADVAFRSAKSLSGDTLIATRLPDIVASVYCSEAYLKRHGAPLDADDLASHDVIVYAGTPGMELLTNFLSKHASGDRIVGSASAPEDMVGSLLSNVGVSVLPCFLGDATPGLHQCFDPPRELDRSWWVVTSAELHATPRVRSFMAFAAERIRLEATGVRRDTGDLQRGDR
jgi:DNA-binding transcriptional LysR family regulator